MALDYDMYELAFSIGQIIGSLFMGAIIGAFPLTWGLIKNRKKLAIGGFVACIIGSFIFGIFLSVPLSILFIILILLTGRGKSE